MYVYDLNLCIQGVGGYATVSRGLGHPRSSEQTLVSTIKFRYTRAILDAYYVSVFVRARAHEREGEIERARHPVAVTVVLQFTLHLYR